MSPPLFIEVQQRWSDSVQEIQTIKPKIWVYNVLQEEKQ